MTYHLAFFIMTFFGTTVFSQTQSDKGSSVRIQGVWIKSGQGDTRYLRLSLQSHLNEKQEELINSGFSTFSQLLVFPRGPRKKDQAPIFEITCTVKFDLWEEKYELARLDKRNPQAASVDTYQEYATLCLTANLPPEIISSYLERGLAVDLHIDQISAAKASEIKEWLVRQQSGVMRGIFSHMLGDLKLSESLKAKIIIPSKD
jgi:hypothetical protein